MRKQFGICVLVVLANALFPSFAVGCDCGYPGAPCKAFANTPTVFAGRVVKISTIERKTASGDEYKDRLVSFEVERSCRGWTAKTAEVVTGWGGGDCGYAFQQSGRYLVYAYPQEETRKLYTGICSRTRPLSEAAQDLEYLENKDDPSHMAGIEGSIEELDSSRAQVVRLLEGISVVVEGPSGRRTVLSNKHGQFQVWGLLPGTYRVVPLLPKAFLPEQRTVELERTACAELRFLATPRRN